MHAAIWIAQDPRLSVRHMHPLKPSADTEVCAHARNWRKWRVSEVSHRHNSRNKKDPAAIAAGLFKLRES
jgi:hypothetical protein